MIIKTNILIIIKSAWQSQVPASFMNKINLISVTLAVKKSWIIIVSAYFCLSFDVNEPFYLRSKGVRCRRSGKRGRQESLKRWTERNRNFIPVTSMIGQTARYRPRECQPFEYRSLSRWIDRGSSLLSPWRIAVPTDPPFREKNTAGITWLESRTGSRCGFSSSFSLAAWLNILYNMIKFSILYLIQLSPTSHRFILFNYFISRIGFYINFRRIRE